MEKCALYLIEDCQRGTVKIGISNYPERRIKEIAKTYNVFRVREIKRTWFDSRDDAQGWESKFHKKYASQQSSLQGGREWFDLSDEQIQGFIQWMEASTNKRALKILTLQAMVAKTPELLLDHRISRGCWAGFFTFAIAMGLTFGNGGTNLIILPFWIIFLIWVASTAPKANKKRAAYMLNGQRINAKVFPIREYDSMGLWDEHLHEIGGMRPCDWQLPSSIPEDQAIRLYKSSKVLKRQPYKWDDL
jgi:predicted GIY-YIG superfamily endonuclease